MSGLIANACRALRFPTLYTRIFSQNGGQILYSEPIAPMAVDLVHHLRYASYAPPLSLFLLFFFLFLLINNHGHR